MSFLVNYLSTDVTAALIFVLVVSVIYLWTSRRPANFPPGPVGFPLVGYIPFLGKNPAVTYMKLQDKYGPVISVRFGPKYWIILNGYDTIHEAFVKNSDVFSSRRSFVPMRPFGVGIAEREYDQVWRDLKKFSVTTLRRFVVEQKTTEVKIVEESKYLIEQLTTNDNSSLKSKLYMAVSNIICGIVFGSRFSYDDQTYTQLLDIVSSIHSASTDSKLMGLIFLAPGLKTLPFIKDAYTRREKEFHTLLGIYKDLIDAHKAEYNKDDIKDLIDAFLKEMNENGGNHPAFNDPTLLKYINDMFQAGTETVSSTLTWVILCLAQRQDCQERIFKEIEIVIGHDKTPSMSHRDNMPYTSAFLHEITRNMTVAPLALLHVTSRDHIFRGYKFPKDSTVLPNLWSVHHDPDLFEDPAEFRPERFLDSQGNFHKSNHVIPFSLGPRSCLGDRLARMELFIFVTSMVQKIRILPHPTKPLPDLKGGHVPFFTFVPLEYDVIFEKR